MSAQAAAGTKDGPNRLLLDFDDNRHLVALFGQHDENLARLEQLLDVEISSRGNRLAIAGGDAECNLAADVLRRLYQRAADGHPIDIGEVEGLVRMTDSGDASSVAGGDASGGDFVGHKTKQKKSSNATPDSQIQISTRKRTITPRSPRQAEFIDSMLTAPMTFGVGPAGTGKTYLAVAMAVARLLAGDVDRIIVSRPAVEAGENLGFLPGDLKEKVDPYLRPIYDALFDMLPTGQVERYMESGQIEIAPLAFMRGRTLSDAFVILDEAQNTTMMQMKMFLTRFGQNSRMVVAGDPTQIDLPGGAPSGLNHALDILREIEGVAIVRFGEVDVVRHALVGRIVGAYENTRPSAAKGANKGVNKGADIGVGEDAKSEPSRDR